MTHIEILKKHRACSGGIAYAEQYASMQETIQACDDISWLRWALRLIADKRKRVGIAAHIARNTPLKDGRTVYDLLKDERSRKALDVCDAYARGEATDEELAYAAADAAATAAYAAYAAYAAAAAAAYDAAYAWQSAYIKSLDWNTLITGVADGAE